MRYDWEVRATRLSQLEAALQAANPGEWEVFAILPAGEDSNASPADRPLYAVVVRRPMK
jgi:hypothetical protein